MSFFLFKNMKNLPSSSRWLATVSALLLLACGSLLSGCLSRPYLNRQTFLFNAPAMGATNVMANGRVLAIRKLLIAAPFDGRPLVYRTGEFSYVRDPYAEFLEPPAQELMVPVQGFLLGTGDFSQVVESGSALRPDTLVEISISQLFGDFRKTGHPAAILTMQFTIFDAPNGVAAKMIFQKEYSRVVPLDAPAAAALMKGWDQALADIFRNLSSDFRMVENLKPR
jgi:ABC-type uncharacterized transport system auxiliary subunit